MSIAKNKSKAKTFNKMMVAPVIERMKKLGLNQSDTAKLCGVERSALCRLLSGKRGLSIAAYHRLITKLGLEVK
jgi:transcriptional regulator with XRE-family HTH domain